MKTRRILSFLLATVVISVTFGPGLRCAAAHGSVTPDSDLCIIKIGYFKAHFKIYQPDTRQQRDYCEDLPDTGHSVFVMEYEHTGLGDVPIDFRIIENVTGKRFFANLDDIEQIDDLDSVTVFHHPFAIQRDVFTIAHTFGEPGNFIGIVTVKRADNGKLYTAVFPFEVGYIGLGYWPWIAAAVLILQLNYLWMGGWFSRFRAHRRRSKFSVIEESAGA